MRGINDKWSTFDFCYTESLLLLLTLPEVEDLCDAQHLSTILNYYIHLLDVFIQSELGRFLLGELAEEESALVIFCVEPEVEDQQHQFEGLAGYSIFCYYERKVNKHCRSARTT